MEITAVKLETNLYMITVRIVHSVKESFVPYLNFDESQSMNCLKNCLFCADKCFFMIRKTNKILIHVCLKM